MPIRVVRLGSRRASGEGVRIGTVRRPPRGVPKSQFAAQDWYDVWYPNLAPSTETLKKALAASTEREWQAFRKAYRHEMAKAEKRALDRFACCAFASHELFGRLLLRG